MRRKLILISLGLIVAGFGALVFYRLFFLHLVMVPTGAMANTVIPGDHLVVKKRAFGEIDRGNILVFSYPDDQSTFYLGRVVGLPGETIHVRGKLIYVNSQPLNEERVTVEAESFHDGDKLQELSSEGFGTYRVFYLRRTEGDVPQDDTPFATQSPFTIPPNNYFLMGHNRDNSADSRFRGPVPRELVFGKPTVIYWSSKPDASGNEKIHWERISTRLR